MTLSMLTALAFAPLLVGGVMGVSVDAFGGRKSAVLWSGAGLFAGACVFAYTAATHHSDMVWGVLRGGGVFATVGAVIAALAAVAVLGGWNSLTEREWGGSLAGLIAFAAAASVVVAGSKDITLLLISLEIAAACAYAIVASGGRSGSREAALKYFIQGAIATGFFVFGMAVMVGVFLPTGDLDGLRAALSGDVAQSVASVAVVLLVGALAFKSGAAPFHSWTPDAYESSTAPSAAFLASSPKIGAVVALSGLAVLSMTGSLATPITAVLVILAVLSIIVGSVTALRQRSYTRMLGYAGVAQVGYALIAVSMSHGLVLPIFFIVSYGIASTGTFLAAQAFLEVRPEWDGTIDGLAGIGRQSPALGVSTSLLVISLAGIPPLLGFWAKFGAFLAAFVAAVAAFTDGKMLLGWLSLIAGVAGVLGSVVSLGYYGAVLRALFQPAPATATAEVGGDEAVVGGLADAEVLPGGIPESPRRWSARAGVLLLAIVVVVVGLVPLFAGVTGLLRIFA